MCAVLSEFGVAIAPSTYYAPRARGGPSRADWSDAQVIDAIYRLRQSNPLYRVLGARKTWIVLRTNGLNVSRCVVERVMREMGWRGACKRRRVRTTVADPAATRAPDHVRRRFVAEARLTDCGWLISRIAGPGPAGLMRRSSPMSMPARSSAGRWLPR
ncbi:IS3 family transposase [Mycolicibacterium crocinum]|uniref:IS3 family transposase n=1 Tax=Mycolicibacterium crocinum TaxID=388459 RepID=A0ABY3TYZ0_9MYCO|nr:IS3 family transposase [Mycolicibacterium crocinum]ULN44629.1 IS3 family transposase [Mycolicibacterium crocinum]